jgi:hypothetical protein
MSLFKAAQINVEQHSASRNYMSGDCASIIPKPSAMRIIMKKPATVLNSGNEKPLQ